MSRDEVRYLHGLLGIFLGAFRKVVRKRKANPLLVEVLPLGIGEEEWLRLAPLGRGPLIARWDLNIDPANGGAKGAKLYELNGCAVGGLHYASVCSEILHEHLSGRASGLRLPLALRDVWLRLLETHARKLERKSRNIAWLEDRTWESGITEGPSLVTLVKESGFEAKIGDPRELELRRGEICLHGQPLDIVYRNIELRDLLAIEAESGELSALREAVRRGMVLSPLDGDLDHKSLLEVWSSRRFAGLFTPRERAAFKRHIPWTRMIGERHTDGPNGKRVDLVEFVRRKREHLVIKPNRSCGGDGVLIGADTSVRKWERAIGAALSGREAQVVQERVPSAKLWTPVVRRGKVVLEEHCTTYGMVAAPKGVGILGRAAPFPVVNVSRGGGLLGVLLV